MALIRPFKAIRPSEQFVKDVAALPYDVMTSDEAREMVKDNPYSFLHVDKAEIDLAKDIHPYDECVYQKAKENLKKLIVDKVLITDAEPHLYIYQLMMNGRIQTGLVACTSIDEYLEGKIKKHELTREDKEQDRIHHVDVTNANTGPIFLTYRYEEKISMNIQTYTQTHQPVYDFTCVDGITHTVWVVDELEVMESLVEGFQAVPTLYIADGHHRNASAVKVGLMRREKNPNYAITDESNYYLSVLFPHTELMIMDYNRLIKDLNGLTSKEFLDSIANHFDVEEKKAAHKPTDKHTFGMYLEGKWYKLSFKTTLKHTAHIHFDEIDSLDVSILQNFLLAPVLNIQDQRTDKRIDFVGGMRGLEELQKRVDSGEMKVAFSMFPTSMDELMLVADANKIMPPKSTWFEPKLRSGIFVHSLE